jgi:hypothetical protein
VHLHLSRILHQRLSLHPSRNQRPNPNLSLSLSPHQAQQIVPVII